MRSRNLVAILLVLGTSNLLIGQAVNPSRDNVTATPWSVNWLTHANDAAALTDLSFSTYVQNWIDEVNLANMLTTMGYGPPMIAVADDVNNLEVAETLYQDRVIDVRWCGAIADGVTDNARAFQLAADVAGPGGTISIPAGTYNFDSPVDPCTYRIWRGVGNGSILRASAANGQAIFKRSGAGISHCIFDSMSLRSQHPDANAIESPDNYYVNNCRFTNLEIYAEFACGVRGLFGNTGFEHCRFGYLGAPGALFQPIIDDSVGGSYLSLNNSYRHCFFRQAVGGRATVQIGYATTQLFDTCVFEHCSVPAVDANGVSDLVFANCSFEGMEPGGTDNCLVVLDYDTATGQGSRAHFTHCRFTNNGTPVWDAIALAEGSGCWASFDNSSGGLASTHWCKEGYTDTYDNAQTTSSRGLLSLRDEHVTGYVGSAPLNWYYRWAALDPVTATNKTSSYTVTWADRGTLFTNAGASGTIVLALPTAVPYEVYRFRRSADYAVWIDPFGAELFRGKGAGKHLRLDDLACTVEIRCTETGIWDIDQAYDPNITDHQMFKWQP